MKKTAVVPIRRRQPRWRWRIILAALFAMFAAGGAFGQNSPESDFHFTASTGTITSYTGAGNRVVVPSSIGGRPVTAIGNYAFDDNKTVTELVLPPSVVSVGNCAFRNSGLRSLTVQGTLTSIGNEAFRGANLQAIINWPEGIQKIPNGSFRETQLKGALAIPEGVTEIGDFAFYGLQIQSVALPRTIARIGTRAFAECGQLTAVSIPRSVTAIAFGSAAFSGAALDGASKKALLDRGAPAAESAYR